MLPLSHASLNTSFEVAYSKYSWLHNKQECIPVGCVLSAAVTVRGVPAWGVPAWGRCTCLGGVPNGGGVPAWRGVPAQGGVSKHALRLTPPVDRMTDACKNITLPQLHCGQ